ncbi:MAG: ribonuclease HII [Bacteroidetes bacterium]|nr:ribonuclease HII [Bacteroidota bacterium]
MKTPSQPLKSFYQNIVLEAGVDEAGRGCLAGPVVAAAVILPLSFNDCELNDSKKLTAKQRQRISLKIKDEALAWAIAEVENEQIDQINILQATFMAMHKAIASLSIKPKLLLIDGNRFKPFPSISHQCFIKGDATYQSIAAASILAKTQRDFLMENYHKQYPVYHWDKNKGYPTKEHRIGIKAFGISPLHRISFQLLPPLALF